MTSEEVSGTRPPGQDIVDSLKERMNARIDNDFTYHAPSGPGQVELYEDMRSAFRQLAHVIVDVTPAGREQSTALTHLEEVMFWTNAAIARQVLSS